MDITVYLPDDIGRRAKDASLNLSRLLRAAVETELRRREEMTKTLSGEPDTIELPIETEDGAFIGRIVGKCIGEGHDGEVSVYLTVDERVIVHDSNKLVYHEIDDPEEELREVLDDDDVYRDALHQLGMTPVIDL